MAAQSIPQSILSDPTALHSFLNDVAGLRQSVSSTMYVNLEGINLGRHGSISIITLYVPSLRKVYHVDAVTLSDAVVSTKTASGTSFKTILESPSIKKVFFDVRNDSDALFARYNILLDGVIDIQLMELAMRNYSRRYLASLAKCIESDSGVNQATLEHWRSFGQLSGRYMLDSRPIDPLLLEFCKLRVALLPNLWRAYSKKLRLPGETFWRCQIRNVAKERIDLAKSTGYDGDSKSKALGPRNWSDREALSDAIDDWNENVWFDAEHDDGDFGKSGDFVMFDKSESDALSHGNGDP